MPCVLLLQRHEGAYNPLWSLYMLHKQAAADACGLVACVHTLVVFASTTLSSQAFPSLLCLAQASQVYVCLSSPACCISKLAQFCLAATVFEAQEMQGHPGRRTSGPGPTNSGPDHPRCGACRNGLDMSFLTRIPAALNKGGSCSVVFP